MKNDLDNAALELLLVKDDPTAETTCQKVLEAYRNGDVLAVKAVDRAVGAMLQGHTLPMLVVALLLFLDLGNSSVKVANKRYRGRKDNPEVAAEATQESIMKLIRRLQCLGTAKHPVNCLDPKTGKPSFERLRNYAFTAGSNSLVATQKRRLNTFDQSLAGDQIAKSSFNDLLQLVEFREELELQWHETKTSLTVGDVVTCTVLRCESYGVFVDIQKVPFVDFIPISFISDELRTAFAEPPAIAENRPGKKRTKKKIKLVANILLFKDAGRQIWLAIGPAERYRVSEDQYSGEFDE